MTDSRYDLLGPFVGHHLVLIEGRRVPFLTAEPANGGRIFLTLDERICVDMSVQDADRLIPFIADCIAVGLGYTGFPREGMPDAVRRPRFPRVTELGGAVDA